MTKQKTITGYKFITSEMKSREGDCIWKVGEWKKHEGNIELCKSGFHACRTALQSLQFIYGNRWFIVEAKGEFKEEKDKKFVCSEMRLIKEIPIDKVVKRFALWCAKQCLKNYEKEYPDDKRVSECIRITELYLDGKATLDELTAAKSAAESAAESAESADWSAESAAKSAAESAESAAWSAEGAAWSAAKSAAESAESAAWSAESADWSAESAAKKEQSKQLDLIIKEVLKRESKR